MKQKLLIINFKKSEIILSLQAFFFKKLHKKSCYAKEIKEILHIPNNNVNFVGRKKDLDAYGKKTISFRNTDI